MGQKKDNKVMKQMHNLWNQKSNKRQTLSNDEIDDMLSSDERVDKLYNMMKGKINEIGDTENGMYAIGQVAGRAYDRMLNSPRKKKSDGVVALDPKYGKVAQDAAYAGAGGYIQWQKNFEKVNGRKPSDKERQAYMQNYHNGVNDYGKPESERKGVVKLSESRLRTIVAESVKKVLKERTLNMKTIGIVSGLMEIKKMSQFLINKYEAIDDSSEGIEAIYNTVHDCVMQLYQVTEQFGY